MAQRGSKITHFVLEEVDPNTNCPAFAVGFAVDDVTTLSDLIRAGDSELRHERRLGRGQLKRIIRKFEIHFPERGWPVRLRRRNPRDDLPYEIHTRNELSLMLRGSKPLAVFSFPSNMEFEERSFFAPHIATCVLVIREFDLPVQLQSRGDSRDTIYRYVLYARPLEEWRIDAYIFMMLARIEEGWSYSSERLEGMLLGYESWQNDLHIERLKVKNGHK